MAGVVCRGHGKWRKGGILPPCSSFAARHDIETRLLKGGNERSLTNYYQILELLAEEDSQSRNPATCING